MANKSSDGSELLIGLGILTFFHQSQIIADKDTEIRNKESQLQYLRGFHEHWKPLNDLVGDKQKLLQKFDLSQTLHRLPPEIRVVFSEAIGCFMYGLFIAAGNLVALTIERIIRHISKDEDSKLFEIIKRLRREEHITPHLEHQLSILREIRNEHSHNVLRISELKLLGLFEAVKECSRIRPMD